jgi:hypothetical protein
LAVLQPAAIQVAAIQVWRCSDPGVAAFQVRRRSRCGGDPGLAEIKVAAIQVAAIQAAAIQVWR